MHYIRVKLYVLSSNPSKIILPVEENDRFVIIVIILEFVTFSTNVIGMSLNCNLFVPLQPFINEYYSYINAKNKILSF